MTVRLGFTVGSGAPVDIPLKHLAICGQTQEAGKTTALEALITRAGLRAVTFVTKRGEGSFTDARRIDPYFREQADWQFVASILEASRGEKLKFERAWIIRASKGARTLADVQRNVRKAMETAKGMSGDVYLTLDAYLEAVVPAIARVRWAPGLELQPCVNAIDLTHVPTEMQHLVIKSCLDWVLEREHDTVVVIPEAWKFIPQGRGTPVKLAAEAFIRQGAALRNLLWLDSQDLGGIEKIILRSVPLWILGVQREANEIKRTLENIPAGIAKPSKADIATLELGQFFACWGKHAIRTYAQPAWMNPAQAEQVATGALALNLAARLSPGGPHWGRRLPPREQEETVNEREAQALKDENAKLREENASLARRLDQLERAAADARIYTGPRPSEARTANRPAPGGPQANAVGPRAEFPAGDVPIDHDTEGLYQKFKARLIADVNGDPVLLKVLAEHPELQVHVTRTVVEVQGDTHKGRVARLMAQGWFDEPRTVGAVRQELKRTGTDPGGGGALGIMLDNFVKTRFFVRDGDGFVLAPGVKVSERELSVA